jgi:predicted CXXCH cytochrome family protein
MKRSLTAVILSVLLVLFYGHAYARVSGVCSNCHTMHNSQNGAFVVREGSGVGWDSSGKLVGGSLNATPRERLLVTTCVGCHSSTTNQTIITLGSNRIPIVFNTVPPANPLAGGNFYWVSRGGAANDVFGHNVFGISGIDNNIPPTTGAPGRDAGPGCSTTGCHYTLATDGSGDEFKQNGCQGCHFKVSHHDDSKHWYRFLLGHLDDSYHVTGIEDPNWEQNPSPTLHNMYQGSTTSYTWGSALKSTNSISTFCSGCHLQFHDDMGISEPWLRHPIDIALPMTGEYGGYDPTTNYVPQAPVAWTNPSSPTRATAVVMCLSCHRAHGSDQPDMLRWDYSTMVASGHGSGGCFTCHTQKN